ncbi:hypothetical protein Ciccas_001846 [Cichlidogyrus casuarinus]|uniref:Uncharacterized protein n=1 Tax=Cichlidogyrus casuarinus TaxID=1844966 RepID=A0ABD2QIV8_9PLAT
MEELNNFSLNSEAYGQITPGNKKPQLADHIAYFPEQTSFQDACSPFLWSQQHPQTSLFASHDYLHCNDNPSYPNFEYQSVPGLENGTAKLSGNAKFVFILLARRRANIDLVEA